MGGQGLSVKPESGGVLGSQLARRTSLSEGGYKWGLALDKYFWFGRWRRDRIPFAPEEEEEEVLGWN